MRQNIFFSVLFIVFIITNLIIQSSGQVKKTSEVDINDIELSELKYLGSLYRLNQARIAELLRNPQYDLLREDPTGQLRLDIVMNLPLHIYSAAILTAFANRNIYLLNEIAKRIVNNASSGEDIIQIVKELRFWVKFEMDEQAVAFEKLFIDKVFRLAIARFAPSTAKPAARNERY